MAGVGRPIRREYQAIRNLLGPRTSTATGATVGPVVIPTHHHAASEITLDPNTDAGGYVESVNVQDGIEELDAEKLARSGVQPMLGALDMNHNSIINADDADIEGTATVAENVSLTGGVGLAQVDPRIIRMKGTSANGEGLIDGVNRVVANADPTSASLEDFSRVELNPDVEPGVDYVAAEGVVSWSNVEGVLGCYVRSGASLVFLAAGWAGLQAFASAP